MNSGNFPLDQSNVPASTMAPPREFPCPPIYFVNEWITIFAPCFIGFNNAGVATVLSTIKGTLADFACTEIASKSKTSNFGFPKDSTKNALVFSCVASAKLSGFDASTNVVVIPNLGNVTLNKL